MLIKFFAVVLVFSLSLTFGECACERDRNVQFQNPLYLNYGDGFFYIQGLTNGESVVIYKVPEDSRVFGQYTFKDERCLYETVYYYVFKGQYEFTNPYISDEQNFNLTNKISFVKNGAGYEIEYNINPRGVGIFHNLGPQAEIKILPQPLIKKTPALNVREITTKFTNLGKQNLKVSYLKNGESYVQFITHRNVFKSIEGQYTLRTSDRKYHTITYEIPLDDLDYNGMVVREYEMSTEENFFKSGVLRIGLNSTEMDVKYFLNSNGFHIADLQQPAGRPVPNPITATVPVSNPVRSGSSILTPPLPIRPVQQQPSVRPTNPNNGNVRPVRNQPFVNRRVPSARQLLTGESLGK